MTVLALNVCLCSLVTYLLIFSLDNLSNHVRWSVDLRWQRASDPAGFYGVKGAVLMRSSKDPNLKINWETFDAINRHEAQDEMLKEDLKVSS